MAELHGLVNRAVLPQRTSCSSYSHDAAKEECPDKAIHHKAVNDECCNILCEFVSTQAFSHFNEVTDNRLEGALQAAIHDSEWVTEQLDDLEIGLPVEERTQ
ncbi:hypothetical protein MAR_017353 [Mya arenaria]|uniref:Uncharacterized protein n=1 Tax=Mya arenaria TaxID=6604 RepID=A0ABY7EBZ2_MYAAR|nr:hypothetical protein MAR_017353 [Mya arenaria]